MLGPTLGGYSLLALLGQGGAADVYLGVASSSVAVGFQKLLVIKHVRGDEHDRDVAFLDEVRLAARLNHPNVVQTNEVGQAGDHHFLVMEYVEGQPLESLLVRVLQGGIERERALPLLLFVLAEALAGLHYAHELKDFDGAPLRIVHRDVSPHNIMITYEGQVKVLDFGIAKAARRAQQTTDGTVKGKIRYMAPEQALGLAVDRRADLFAAGVILYEIVSGQELWGDAGDMQVLGRLLDGDYPVEARNVPAPLAAILRKSLQRDAGARYASAADFRRDLIDSLRSMGELDDLRDDLAAAMKTLFSRERQTMSTIVRDKLAAPDPFALMPQLRDTRPDRTSTLLTAAPRKRTSVDEVDKTQVMAPPVWYRQDEPTQLGPIDTTETFVALARMREARSRRSRMLVALGVVVTLALLVAIVMAALNA